MKKIEAIIRPHLLDAVRNALQEVGVAGMTIGEVQGFGRQKGHTETYRGTEYQIEFIPKIKLEVIVPEEPARTCVHDVIFNELCAGQVLPSSRDDLLAIIEDMKAAGADSVILGCTEICLTLDPAHLPLPGFDSTAIHCDAAARFAFADNSALERQRKYA